MHSKHAWFPACTPFHSTTFYKGVVFRVVEEFLMVIAHSECSSKHGDGCFTRKVLAAFDVGNLINGKFTKLCEFLLAHVRAKSQLFDTDAEIGLNRLYPFHIFECVQLQFLMTPSNTTGYSVGRLGGDYALDGLSGAKSKKSLTGTPSVMEKVSIDSKEGALTPRSTMLRKSTEISRSSAKSSCVIPRPLRIERNFLPNSFRKVATFQVWRNEQDNNTEYHYGFWPTPGVPSRIEMRLQFVWHTQPARGPL